MGRELVRLGYVRQTTDKFSVLEMTKEGITMLKQRSPVRLTKPIPDPEMKTRLSFSKQAVSGEGVFDEPLFNRLRRLRKQLADERDVPAYIIFSDVSLRQMTVERPANEQEFLRISGVGEKKLKEFGADFLREIAVGPHLGA
jgi:ATP-dependent DNA helicase RecQ